MGERLRGQPRPATTIPQELRDLALDPRLISHRRWVRKPVRSREARRLCTVRLKLREVEQLPHGSWRRPTSAETAHVVTPPLRVRPHGREPRLRIGSGRRLRSPCHLALGVEAVRAGRSVYFSPLADIIDSLARAEREGRLRERIRFLCRSSLLIIDEIGYLSVGAGAGNLFFQLVNARYERGAMILISNRGFAEWGKVFGDPVVATALLDRLLHHAVVVHIEGASYRLRQHADLVPESLRPPQHAKATADAPRRRGRPPKTPAS
jgi:IstB-like ATP binding protein